MYIPFLIGVNESSTLTGVSPYDVKGLGTDRLRTGGLCPEDRPACRPSDRGHGGPRPEDAPYRIRVQTGQSPCQPHPSLSFCPAACFHKNIEDNLKCLSDILLFTPLYLSIRRTFLSCCW